MRPLRRGSSQITLRTCLYLNISEPNLRDTQSQTGEDGRWLPLWKFKKIAISRYRYSLRILTSPAQSNLGTAASHSPHCLQRDAPNSPQNCPSPSMITTHLIHPYLDRPHSSSQRHPDPLNRFATIQRYRLINRRTDKLPDGPSHKPLTLAW